MKRASALILLFLVAMTCSRPALAAPTALQVYGVSERYHAPWLLDFNFSLRDQDNHAVAVDPTQITVVCKEDGAAISPSETGFRLLSGNNKQLKCFLVLDYTLSMADPLANGDTNNNGYSDALDTMEQAAKTLIGTLSARNPDAQIGLYEFHREDAAHPPLKVSDLTVDRASLSNRIDSIWDDYVQWFPAATRCWDAVYAAVNEFPSSNPRDDQRFVVFLSDGKDESSTRTPSDIISQAVARGVRVYAVGFGRELTPAALQNIAGQTSGQYYPATSLAQLAARFDQITEDLKGQYILRWATLKRSSASFVPSFALTYQGVTANRTGSPFSPNSTAGDALVGRLAFDGSLGGDHVATITLNASYVPRFITRLRLNVASVQSMTVEKVLGAEGGICPDNWVLERNDAEGWIELRSPTPQNIFTALPFATLGKILRFRVPDVTALNRSFDTFSVDNSIYAQTGGQSFAIENVRDVSALPQTVSFGPIAARFVDDPPLTLSATASSGLAVSFRVVSGPATIAGNTLTVTGPGAVVMRAEQGGNAAYGAAFAEQSFGVLPVPVHGTPRSWLRLYGQGEEADPDGDGQAMWEEYVAGTKPDDSQSVCALSAVEPAGGGGWQVFFPTVTNRIYEVDWSADLSTWVSLETNLVGLGGLMSLLDPTTGTLAQRFYRLSVTKKPWEPTGMVWIEPGTFTMGSPSSEPGRDSDEGPQTVVTLTQGFWLGRYEVTQREYQAVRGVNPSFSKGDNLPVENVSWNDAVAYCQERTQQERAAGTLPEGWAYRLPTEAEWEYACRAGTTSRFSFGDSDTDLGQYAWYSSNSSSRTHPVGEKLPYPWGLYDMHGNVWEWCLDWYGSGLPGGSVTDPKGPSSGSVRVLRGGGWSDVAGGCRSATRFGDYPDGRYGYFGFRVLVAPGQP